MQTNICSFNPTSCSVFINLIWKYIQQSTYLSVRVSMNVQQVSVLLSQSVLYVALTWCCRQYSGHRCSWGSWLTVDGLKKSPSSWTPCNSAVSPSMRTMTKTSEDLLYFVDLSCSVQHSVVAEVQESFCSAAGQAYSTFTEVAVPCCSKGNGL